MRPVITSVLKNGFRIYSQYDNGDSTNLCGVCVKVGGTSDPPPFYGLAHLLEHTLFRQTPNNPLIKVLLAMYRLGRMGSLNVSTNSMTTLYGTGDLLRRRHLKESFDIIADLVRNFKIDLAGPKTEKAAIRPEIILAEDDIADDIIEILYENIYTTNPIRNRVAGFVPAAKMIPPSRLVNFYRRYYVASNMAAIILGPKHKEAVEMAKKFFDDMPFVKPPELFMGYKPGENPAPRFDTIKTIVQERQGIHITHLAIGFPMKIAAPKDESALELMASVLEFRLWTRLREENQDFRSGVYGVSASFESSKLHSVFMVQTALDTSRIDKATEIIINEFQKLRAEPVDEPLFEASREQLLSDYKMAFAKSAEMLLGLIVNAFANGDEELIWLHRYPKILNRLVPKKLLAVADQYVNPLNSVRVIIKPVG